MPKPTVEARLALYAGALRKAEEIRVQVRKQHQASLKRGKYAKHSIELEEFQKLTDRYIGEVDKILASLKKATGAK
ncbi:putative ribosome recycling factor [Lyophyllum shimeji]|uniref:Ribosome recycling factor n=1 Tax=Lyophyllum shimeji TaxID=47721 RepID=A0A9P3PNQ9_LYOSH|nr:putative ribosome recycling factor [Lyophyllum shimeji]